MILIARTISLAAAVFTVHADPPCHLPKNHARPSAISAQIFDLLKVGITLALTGLIGGGITYYYQERAHRAQQEQADLATARQSALTFLREVGDILEMGRSIRIADTTSATLILSVKSSNARS
jgi:hypothetical protein